MTTPPIPDTAALVAAHHPYNGLCVACSNIRGFGEWPCPVVGLCLALDAARRPQQRSYSGIVAVWVCLSVVGGMLFLAGYVAGVLTP